MPDLNFPSSPSLNQTYTAGNLRWNWNGYAWQLIPKTKFTYDSTSPSDPVNGDQWYNTSTSILYVYVNSQWLDINAISGVSSVGGATGAVSNVQLSAALTSAGCSSGNPDDAIIFTSLLSGI